MSLESQKWNRNFQSFEISSFFLYHKEKIVSFIFDGQINGLWSIDSVKQLKPLQRLHWYGFAFWKLIINTIIRYWFTHVPETCYIFDEKQKWYRLASLKGSAFYLYTYIWNMFKNFISRTYCANFVTFMKFIYIFFILFLYKLNLYIKNSFEIIF